MFTLENETLLINVVAKGAELTRIYHKQNRLDYLWDAKPEVWAKHSPVLFPVVGALKENSFLHEGKSYELSRHGFARESVFEVGAHTGDSISFTLRDDDATKENFPFRFEFTVTYRLTANTVSVTYLVTNPDAASPLLFSVGGHPAFRLPLEEGLQYEDYVLLFNKEENSGRWPVSKGGLIEQTPQPLLENTNELPLHKNLFLKDALVLKDLKSDSVRLVTAKSDHGIQFHFPDFPFLGIWAAPGADFLCIEPWCGIADSVQHNQQLEQKEGIIHLPAGKTFNAAWQVSCF
jgi:galactose mutarotase-like enzyme